MCGSLNLSAHQMPGLGRNSQQLQFLSHYAERQQRRHWRVETIQ